MTPAIGPSDPRRDRHYDVLVRRARERFATIPDARRTPTFSSPDTLLAGLAGFALKDPSLLAFQRRALDPNRRTAFGRAAVPSDSQMRAVLDGTDPNHVRPVFRDAFARRQDARVSDPYRVEGCYVVALDGVEYFCSQEVHGPHGMTRQHANGTASYYHQMLGAAVVHPDFSEVIAPAPEPIRRAGGRTKNDGERNAARRRSVRFREGHPDLPVIAIEDALSSNAPRVRDLQKAECHFLLGAKAAGRAHPFEHVSQRQGPNAFEFLEGVEAETGVRRGYLWVTDVPLNGSHEDVPVTFLHLLETHPDGTGHEWTGVTDLAVGAGNVRESARAARARWRIENGTFNTLENPGYQFAHNFGRGEKNLSVVRARPMRRAFVFDPVQQRCNPLFPAAPAKKGARTALWEQVRHLFASFEVSSMGDVYRAIAVGFRRPQLNDLIGLEPGPTTSDDTS